MADMSNEWLRLLEGQKQIDEQQKRDLLSNLNKNKLPTFDENLAFKTNQGVKENIGKMLSSYSDSPISAYSNSGSATVADKFNAIADNLSLAQKAYGARNQDISRGMNRNQDVFTNKLGMLSMGNNVNSAISGRVSNSKINEINRASQVERMNAEYKARIEELKRQAAEAKRKGDTQAWMAAIGAIGTIVGSLAGGPVGGMIGGALGTAAGSQMGGQ
jgi:hypothetical protein